MEEKKKNSLEKKRIIELKREEKLRESESKKCRACDRRRTANCWDRDAWYLCSKCMRYAVCPNQLAADFNNHVANCQHTVVQK